MTDPIISLPKREAVPVENQPPQQAHTEGEARRHKLVSALTKVGGEFEIAYQASNAIFALPLFEQELALRVLQQEIMAMSQLMALKAILLANEEDVRPYIQGLVRETLIRVTNPEILARLKLIAEQVGMKAPSQPEPETKNTEI